MQQDKADLLHECFSDDLPTEHAPIVAKLKATIREAEYREGLESILIALQLDAMTVPGRVMRDNALLVRQCLYELLPQGEYRHNIVMDNRKCS